MFGLHDKLTALHEFIDRVHTSHKETKNNLGSKLDGPSADTTNASAFSRIAWLEQVVTMLMAQRGYGVIEKDPK